MSGSEAPGRLASRAPVTDKSRTGQQRQIDVTVERHGAAGRGTDARGYFSLVGVPVDQAGNDEDSADNQQQNGQDFDEKLLHASSADTVRYSRFCSWQLLATRYSQATKSASARLSYQSYPISARSGEYAGPAACAKLKKQASLSKPPLLRVAISA